MVNLNSKMLMMELTDLLSLVTMQVILKQVLQILLMLQLAKEHNNLVFLLTLSCQKVTVLQE